MEHMKRKYARLSLVSWGLCALLLGYELIAIGAFDRGRIVITTLATTGPDFEVVLGRWKLAQQMPDTLELMDVTGIMVTGQGAKSLGHYLSEHYQAFGYGDYFVLNWKMIGVQRSDSEAFHPLLELVSWKRLDPLVVGMLFFADIGLLLISGWFYRRFKIAPPLLQPKIH